MCYLAVLLHCSICDDMKTPAVISSNVCRVSCTLMATVPQHNVLTLKDYCVCLSVVTQEFQYRDSFFMHGEFLDLSSTPHSILCHQSLSWRLTRLSIAKESFCKGVLSDSEVVGICDSKMHVVGLMASLIGSNTSFCCRKFGLAHATSST